MSHMQPQVFLGFYYEVQAGDGETWIVPCEVAGRTDRIASGALQAYVEPTIDNPDEEVSSAAGWLARMSAPGFLDCTEWSVHTSEEEAREYLAEFYGAGESDEE